MWTTLQGALKLTRVFIDEMGGDDVIYVPIEKAFECAGQADKIIRETVLNRKNGSFKQ